MEQLNKWERGWGGGGGLIWGGGGGGGYENSQNYESMSTAHIMPLILTNSPYEKEKNSIHSKRSETSRVIFYQFIQLCHYYSHFMTKSERRFDGVVFIRNLRCGISVHNYPK